MVVAADRQRIQRALVAFDFKKLFIEALGWDILREPSCVLAIDRQSYAHARRKTRFQGLPMPSRCPGAGPHQRRHPDCNRKYLIESQR